MLECVQQLIGAVVLGTTAGLIASVIYATVQGRARECASGLLETHEQWTWERRQAAGRAALARLDAEFETWRDEALG